MECKQQQKLTRRSIRRLPLTAAICFCFVYLIAGAMSNWPLLANANSENTDNAGDDGANYQEQEQQVTSTSTPSPPPPPPPTTTTTTTTTKEPSEEEIRSFESTLAKTANLFTTGEPQLDPEIVLEHLRYLYESNDFDTNGITKNGDESTATTISTRDQAKELIDLSEEINESKCNYNQFQRYFYLIEKHSKSANLVAYIRHQREKVFDNCIILLRNGVSKIPSDKSKRIDSLRESILEAKEQGKSISLLPIYSTFDVPKAKRSRALIEFAKNIEEKPFKFYGSTKAGKQKFFIEFKNVFAGENGICEPIKNLLPLCEHYNLVLFNNNLFERLDSFTIRWLTNVNICRDFIESSSTLADSVNEELMLDSIEKELYSTNPSVTLVQDLVQTLLKKAIKVLEKSGKDLISSERLNRFKELIDIGSGIAKNCTPEHAAKTIRLLEANEKYTNLSNYLKYHAERQYNHCTIQLRMHLDYLDRVGLEEKLIEMRNSVLNAQIGYTLPYAPSFPKEKYYLGIVDYLEKEIPNNISKGSLLRSKSTRYLIKRGQFDESYRALVIDVCDSIEDGKYRLIMKYFETLIIDNFERIGKNHPYTKSIPDLYANSMICSEIRNLKDFTDTIYDMFFERQANKKGQRGGGCFNCLLKKMKFYNA